jgi:hypothetical protein
MKKLSDYNGKKLCECFNCFNLKQNQQKDITQCNIDLKDSSGEIALPIVLERGKFLSYFGTRFAKVDQNGIIHIFKDYMR